MASAVHLRRRGPDVAVKINLAVHAGPEQRFCPAEVYEFAQSEDGSDYLVINVENCMQCKICDIKAPTQNINWIAPEGGGGPNYSQP